MFKIELRLQVSQNMDFAIRLLGQSCSSEQQIPWQIRA